MVRRAATHVLVEQTGVYVVEEAADVCASRNQRVGAHHVGVNLKAIQRFGVGAYLEAGQVGSGCLCDALAHPGVVSSCHGAAGVLNDQDPGHPQQVHAQDQAARASSVTCRSSDSPCSRPARGSSSPGTPP